MKKLLLILLCLPMIGMGQDVSYIDLIKLNDLKSFEKLMYEKKFRYIEGNKEYSLHDGVWDEKTRNFKSLNFILTDDLTEIEHKYDDYHLRKSERSSFGKNYNSQMGTAETFYKMNIASRYYSYKSPSYMWNYIGFEIQFSDQSDFEKFWNTINIPIEYYDTDKKGTRTYKYKKIEFKITDYDDGITVIEIINNL